MENKKIVTNLIKMNSNFAKCKYEEVEISKIKMHELNTKYFSDHASIGRNSQFKSEKEGNSFEQLLASIKALGGIHTPILLTKDYRIISGHRRYLAYCKLGINKIPSLIIQKNIPEALEKFLIIDCNIQGRNIQNRLPQLRKERLQCYFDLIPGLESRLISKDAKITAKEISQITGVSEANALNDLRTLKTNAGKKVRKIIHGEAGIDTNSLISTSNHLNKVERNYIVANSPTRLQTIDYIVKLLKKLHKTR